MKGRVLVAGYTTRHVAQSAWKAGYLVYAVDHFCDQDLSWYTRDRAKFEELGELREKVEELCARYAIDFLVATSGAETIRAPVRLCGTDPAIAERFLDKLETSRFFIAHGIPSPALLHAPEFPCVVKPRRGAGGWRNRLVNSERELAEWMEEFRGDTPVLQRYAGGLPASVSCLTDGEGAVALAANEQLLGGEGDAPFRFAGSITPLVHPLASRAIRLAERTVAASGCRGSVGVDFVLGQEACAIELNPRFQATVDTVEGATGCNLFQLHVNACRGELPSSTPVPVRYSARGILFAERDLVVKEDLSPLFPAVADIPFPGTELEEGNAILSVFGTGPTREDALEMLNNNITRVRRYIRQ